MNYISLTNTPILGDYEWRGNYNLLNIILIGIPNEIPEQKEEYRLHRLLSTMFSSEIATDKRLDILETEYKIAREERLGRELTDMCNLSQGILERGIQQGMQQGMQQGVQQENDRLNKEHAIKLYMKGWSVEEIANFVSCSTDKVENWLETA